MNKDEVLNGIALIRKHINEIVRRMVVPYIPKKAWQKRDEINFCLIQLTEVAETGSEKLNECLHRLMIMYGFNFLYWVQEAEKMEKGENHD